MAQQKTPHTQTQQDTSISAADADVMEGEQQGGNQPLGNSNLELRKGTVENELPTNVAGAQTGGTRAFNANMGNDAQGHQAVEQQTQAYEGSLTTRTPEGQGPGISNASVSDESARQKKVVNDRPDAQAGVNHSKTA